MDKHLSKLIPALFLVLIIGAIGVLFLNNHKAASSNFASPVVLPAVVPQSQVTSQVAPDGKNTLTMKKQSNGNLLTYTFTAADGTFFTKDNPIGVTMSIPFNTWSTDDKTFFVKEDTGSVTNWYVYPGATNVSDYFSQKFPNLKIGDITGWAANTLLIVNTNNPDGTQGFTYWFDIQSHSFIQLAERFN